MNRKELKALTQALEAMKEQVRPDAGWKQSNRELLLSEVKSSVTRTAGWRDGVKSFAKQFLPTEVLQLVRGPVVAVVSIIIVALGGSIASVSASERSLPGDLLYPIKIVAEQTRLVFTTNKSSKLKLKTEFVERRVSEIKTVAASDDNQKPEKVKAAAENIKRDLNTVKNQLQEVKSVSTKDSVEAAKLVDKKSVEIAKELKDVKEGTTGEVKKTVAEAEVAAVNTSVKAVEVLIEAKKNPEVEEHVSDEELTQSIKDKVENLEKGIAATAEKLNVDVGSTGTATSSTVVTATTTTEGTQPIEAATESLNEAKALLQENKLDEVPDKLIEAVKAAADAEIAADTVDVPTEEPVDDPDAGAASSTSSGAEESGDASQTQTDTSTSSTQTSSADSSPPPSS